MGLAVICQLSLTGRAAGAATAAATTKTATTAATGAVAPNPVNELDCNGWSAKYGTVRKLAGNLCTDPISIKNGKAGRFIDNNWYVGHDEPSVKFISNKPGSGNTMTYLMKVSKDPRKAPTANGSVVDYGQLGMGGYSKGCVWNFGNDQPNTIRDFGRDAQYGSPDLAIYGGTLISAPMPNPQFTGRCRI